MAPDLDLDLDHALLFAALPDPHAVLTPDLVLRAANRAFLDVTGHVSEELVGLSIAEAFPVNPADPTAADRIQASLVRAMTSRSPDHMGVVRYDLPRTDGAGYTSRFWSVTCSPVLDDDGEVVLLVQRVRDVTDVRTDLVKALELYRDEIGPGGQPDETDDLLADLAVSSAATGDLARALATELAQMRDAMASRATIEQAKGILMGQRRCSADEGFGALVELSQNTNRKLRDVAAALVADAPVSQP